MALSRAPERASPEANLPATAVLFARSSSDRERSVLFVSVRTIGLLAYRRVRVYGLQEDQRLRASSYGSESDQARTGRTSTQEANASSSTLADLDPSTSCRPLPAPAGRGACALELIQYDDRNHRNRPRAAPSQG